MKEHITGDSIANDIRMRRSLVKEAFLIVEGEKDLRTLRSFIDDESCHVIIAFGKENAVRATRILNDDEFRGFLAIVDADFDRVLGSVAEESNLLLTEFHDLECMLLVSSSFDRVLDELGSKDRIKKFANQYGSVIVNVLAKSAEPIGCLRLVSIKEEFNLKFDGLAVSDFLNRSTLACDIPSLVQTVLNRSQRHDLDGSNLESAISDELNPGHDLWQLVCGHDVVDVLAFALRRVFAARNAADVAPEKLEQHLRLAFDKDDFLSTGLASSLTEWEVSNSGYNVLL